jgi:hypothetical protein
MARPPVKGPIVIPSCAEVKLEWLINGVVMTNVVHSELIPAGPIDPAVATSIFSGIKSQAASTAWFAHLHPEVSFTAVEVKDLRAANNASYRSTGIAMVGTGTGTPLSQGTAMVITLRTNKSGRGFTGRLFLGGLDSSVLSTARNFATTQLDLAVAFVNGINSVVTPLLGRLVVAQRALAADPTSQNPAMTQPRQATTVPVISVDYADTRVDSQRSRLGR